jgi:hypothetical protein
MPPWLGAITSVPEAIASNGAIERLIGIGMNERVAVRIQIGEALAKADIAEERNSAS